MEWNLLEKTTFWIEDIDLEGTNLDDAAHVAAGCLGMEPSDIMVVDVRPGLLAFDILKPQVVAESIAGKQEDLLAALSKLAGVKLGPSATVHSEGVLGFIGLDPEAAKEALLTSQRMTETISNAVAKRAMVFASGAEVIAGKIEDTNSPYIMEQLAKHGFQTRFGGILEDNISSAASRLSEAVSSGYGLIISTGGVGAEDKDFSVEAILKLDPQAYTPWILRFKPDYRRHHKEGVRIAVGKVGASRLVALPGPHEEAKLGCDYLLSGLANKEDIAGIAENIAEALRNRWREAMHKGGNHHEL